MAEEIDFENGRNSNFEGLVTLTLTFDPAIRHTMVMKAQAVCGDCGPISRTLVAVRVCVGVCCGAVSSLEGTC